MLEGIFTISAERVVVAANAVLAHPVAARAQSLISVAALARRCQRLQSRMLMTRHGLQVELAAHLGRYCILSLAAEGAADDRVRLAGTDGVERAMRLEVPRMIAYLPLR